jgi:hypothetical protein
MWASVLESEDYLSDPELTVSAVLADDRPDPTYPSMAASDTE